MSEKKQTLCTDMIYTLRTDMIYIYIYYYHTYINIGDNISNKFSQH